MRILGIGNARSVIFLRWAWRLAERGHRVFVVSDRFSERSEELSGLELFDIRELDCVTRIRGLRRLRFRRALTELAGRLGIDVVHGHYLLPYGYWAALIDGPPLVISPWGTDILVDAHGSLADRRRARRALSRANQLVVNSRVSADTAVALGADPGRIDEIVWYADVERFGPERLDPGFRARLGWPDGALVLLSLRNFRPDTNVDVIVRAFRRIADREPRARLVLAARGGPLQSEIEALVDGLGLRSLVAFLSVGEEELPRLVASSDLLVAMTRSDSTPASLLEAMASGLPAVCARAASVDEWLEDGKGGLLVAQRDERALSLAAIDLLADPARRRRYGEHNRRLVAERLSAPGPQLERLYERLLNRGAGHAPRQSSGARQSVLDALADAAPPGRP